MTFGRCVRSMFGALASVLVITIVLLAVPAIPVTAQTPNPPCFGNDCDGIFPDEAVSGGFSCAAPPSDFAVNDVRTATAPAGGGVATVILRYSEWCNAYWAKGIFAPNGASAWGMDVQVTNDDYIIAEHYFDRNPATDNFTRMFGGDDDGTGTRAEACVEITDPTPAYTVCTNRVTLQFIGAGSFANVGTDCRNPTNFANNIWHFRVVGLPPPGGGINIAAQLTDGTGGIWRNTDVYPCVSPWRWLLKSQPLVIGSVYAGLDVYVAAYPGTNSVGATPVPGRTYTLSVTDTFGNTFNPTYRP
ncbi:MAG: hypothetical protein OHK0022_15850 [Roseiflexaceae bacterium]